MGLKYWEGTCDLCDSELMHENAYITADGVLCEQCAKDGCYEDDDILLKLEWNEEAYYGKKI